MINEIATVEDLIEFLKTNFSPSDKLAFFDEGGAWCELMHVPKSLVGDMFLKYASKKKAEELADLRCKKEDEEHLRKTIEENYRLVEEGVVIF